MQSIDEKLANKKSGAMDDPGPARHVSLRRPPPPPLSHTSPPPQTSSAGLRQSASFSSSAEWSADMTAPRAGNHGPLSKRHSDDARDPNGAVHRKKSGFSQFLNSVLGSPRRINISHPENPVHVTHVGYDSETGQFTVGARARPPPPRRRRYRRPERGIGVDRG